MKWISLAPIIALLTACACCGNWGGAEYSQASYAPTIVASPVVATPVYYDPVTAVDDDPIDVTTTTVDYY